MNVCEAMLDVLADYGVRYIFGIPGDAINELIEAVRKQNRIKFIHVMHEEAGAFAASAQAKLTGELAACVGTAGPGAIHLLNGLYDAKLDHAPVIAITGQVETSLIGQDSHQEVNLTALFNDVTCFNAMVSDAGQLPALISIACQKALRMRGVAHINLPGNIATKEVGTLKARKHTVAPLPEIKPSRHDIQRAAKIINESTKPCILAGIGAKAAVSELLKLAARIKAPIINTLRGKDLFPDDNPYALGGLGMLGTSAASKAIKTCDLLLIIGSDFPYREFYPDPGINTIQIDINAQQLSKRHPVSMPLTGDAYLTLSDLLQYIEMRGDGPFLSECRQDMSKWKEAQRVKEESSDEPIHPQRLAYSISKYAAEDAIICCDTGAVTVWAARHFQMKGNQLFTLSGGLASMAFALPAAIGAQLSYPKRQVIALCGDGGFGMLMSDFATCVKYNLPVKIFVFNNSKLALIQMEQEAGSGNPEYQTSLHNPDYAIFAEACGAKGFTIHSPDHLEQAIMIALSDDKPCIINVYINSEELTLPPEISAGQAFNYIKSKAKEFLSKS